MHDRMLGEDYTLACAYCGLEEQENQEWIFSSDGWYCSDTCRKKHSQRMRGFRYYLKCLVADQWANLLDETPRVTLYQKAKEKRVKRQSQSRWVRHKSVEARAAEREACPPESSSQPHTPRQSPAPRRLA